MKKYHARRVVVTVFVSFLLFSFLLITCLLLTCADGGISSCQDLQSVRSLLRQEGSLLLESPAAEEARSLIALQSLNTSLATTSEDHLDSPAMETHGFLQEGKLVGNENRIKSPQREPELSETETNPLHEPFLLTRHNRTASWPTSGPQQRGSPDPFREFPPLYKPVLPNGMNCTKLWTGDPAEVNRAQTELNDTLPARRPPGFYQSITVDCQRYREKAGYIMNVSESEREFPLAFSVMVYKEVEQVERLLRAVYRPHNVYCMHLDLKTHPHVVRDLRSLMRCLPNVYESKRRLDVVWGHFNVLHMELLCMDTLWATSVRWRYLINLTGQEFPLKTNKELVDILVVYNGANDILGEKPKVKNMWRWKKAGGTPPHNISVAKGPVHIAASRGFVDFVLHSEYAKDLLDWTKKTGIPDETFFATINNMHQFGVPGSYTGSLTAKHRIMLNRFKVWNVNNHTCSGEFVRSICHLGPREVSLLAHSRNMVANKFSYNLHPLAWDCTEQWYFDRVRREGYGGERPSLDLRPYRNLVIVKHALRQDSSPWG